MIRIVADSTNDLPQEIINKFGIETVPLFINFGDQGYLDQVEISRKEFYERMIDADPLPTTATPGVDMFQRAYSKLVDEGANQILSIHISESLSATVNVARTAAKQFDTAPVTIYDSRQLSLGMGYLVIAAAEAAQENETMENIIARLDELNSRTYVFAALETLDYLQRSGRMSGVVARLGNILRVKPILKMHEGDPTGERVRTYSRAISRLLQLARELGNFERLDLVHTNAPSKAEHLQEISRDLFPPGIEPLSVDVTPALGANIGPGVVGFSCIKAK
ncbi:MAG: DegV family protein [Anaerolineales bacterium]|jgi:DegV family protein with EDD domain